MNALIQTTASITSREIAELVEKRHENVWRTIETLVENGAIRNPQIEFSESINNLGLARKIKHYVFTGEQGKRDSIVVVAQLSPEFTARLVDRWLELESAAHQPHTLIPQTLPEALRLAADLADQKLALEQQVAEQAPKVQAFNRIADADGLLTLRETATTLKVPERKFIQWMQQHDWLYRRPGKGTLLGYAERIKQGFLEHKAITIHNTVTGLDEVREHVRVTPRGLSILAQRFGEVPEALSRKSTQHAPLNGG